MTDRTEIPTLEELINWPSIRDVCRKAGICQNTGYNWVWQKKVEAVQILGSWRVNPRDVERMLQQKADRSAKKSLPTAADLDAIAEEEMARELTK